MKITNTAKGMRGLWVGGKLKMIEAGETADVDLSKEDLARAEKTGYFEAAAPETKSKAAPSRKKEDGPDVTPNAD